MLKSIKDLHGYRIHATDGEIGKVDEFLFDDQKWTVRYLVVKTGGWLLGRKVLISTKALAHPNRDLEIFPVGLTKEQIENSPSIDTDKPVTRQHEHDLHAHYGWPAYWEPGAFAGELAIAQSEYMGSEDEEKAGDPHLRSTNIVRGYNIYAKDGRIGHIDDFIMDDANWTIKYLIVDIRGWLPERRVIISPRWIEKLDWLASNAYINLAKEDIETSPKFDPSKPMDDDYEDRLHDHYGLEKK